MFSLIFLSTSLITLIGVDAPAVMDNFVNGAISAASRSLLSPIRYVRSHTERQTSYSFTVLELERLPITTTASDVDASSRASVCLSAVTLHIVSKIIGFVYSFSIIFKLFFHSLNFCVV